MPAKDSPNAAETAAKKEPIKIKLRQPIGEITEITLRKPAPGEMRGMMLGTLGAGDVDQVSKLLPRITMPPISKDQIATMDLADFTDCTQEIIGFLRE